MFNIILRHGAIWMCVINWLFSLEGLNTSEHPSLNALDSKFGQASPTAQHSDLLENDLSQHPEQEIAIIQLSFDGINTFHCGVGAIVVQVNEILKKLNNQQGHNRHFKLYLLSGNYSDRLPEYSAETLNKNILDCFESGGEVHLIPTSRGHQMFGDPLQWEELCEGGAKICAQIINQNTYTLVLAHDTAYAQIPRLLKQCERTGEIKKSYQALWIPHATSWSYNGHTQDGAPKWPERHEWEMTGCREAANNGYQIAYIGPTIKEDLLSFPFNVPKTSLFSFRTGILLEPYLKEASEETIALELQKRGIPLDKNLIFSIGRANPLKGQDITLEMYRHLKPLYPNLHLVMLAPESDYMPEYLALLKRRIQLEQMDVTLIEQFDAHLAYFIYQWPKTMMVSLLSRADTQPLTVMEARVNPKHCVVLASNKEGMGTQVQSGKDGFVCPLEGLDDIIQKPMPLSGSLAQIVARAQQILELSTEERQRIIEAGKTLIREHYDLEKNIKLNLQRLLSQRSPSSFLSRYAQEIAQFYGWKKSLCFKELTGGLNHRPVAVFVNNEIPMGVLKKVTNDEKVFTSQFDIIASLKAQGFPHFPSVLTNQEGQYCVKLGDDLYSCIEFLFSDARSVSFEEMLEITGKLHLATRSIALPEFRHSPKLNEYKDRSSVFMDLWFVKNKPEIVNHPFWTSLLEWHQFFMSDQFQSIYQSLPMQWIHGDNNQTNIVISSDVPYFIDFDAMRCDLRLLDLVSYFRYGGFDQYMHLRETKSLFETIHRFYGKFAEALTSQEERCLDLMLIFSHVEFLSWALQSLKKAYLCEALEQEKKLTEACMLYMKQLQQIVVAIVD